MWLNNCDRKMKWLLLVFLKCKKKYLATPIDCIKHLDSYASENY